MKCGICGFFTWFCYAFILLSPAGASLEEGFQAVRLKQFNAAADFFLERAKAGDAEAQYQIAGLYRQGRGVQRNLEESRRWLEAAALQGHRQATSVSKRQLDFQSPVVSREDDSEELLRQAAQRGDQATINALITLGAAIDAQSVGGRTALIEAADNNQLETVNLLLASGANVAVADLAQETALMKAARRGHLEIVSMLQNAGADLAIVNIHANTALMLAVRKGYVNIAKALLDSGAPVNPRDANGRSALDLARLNQNDRLIDMLRRQPGTEDIRRPGARTRVSSSGTLEANGRSLLTIAASRGDRRWVNKLLREGSNAGERDSQGRTPLMLAAHRGHLPVVQLLIEGRADPNAMLEGGLTALHLAARSGHRPVVQVLLPITDVSSSPTNRTLLMHAVSSNSEVTVQLVLDAQPETIHTRDTSGMTALMHAVKGNAGDAASLLVAAGASGSDQDLRGRTALWHAAESGQIGLIPALARDAAADIKDVRGNTPLHRAALSGDVDLVSALLRLGQETVDAENGLGETPLMLAASGHHFSVVEHLVQAGADLDHRNQSGNSALMIAVTRGRSNDVTKLLQMGADPDTQNHDRRNAHDVANRIGIADVIAVLDRY